MALPARIGFSDLVSHCSYKLSISHALYGQDAFRDGCTSRCYPPIQPSTKALHLIAKANCYAEGLIVASASKHCARQKTRRHTADCTPEGGRSAAVELHVTT